MILGIGIDMTDIPRIQRLLERRGARLLARLFGEEERAAVEAIRPPDRRAAAVAKRFAAKEAAAKALGCGIGAKAGLREIAVGHLPSGQPALLFSGKALETLHGLTPRGHTARLHLSLSDDHPKAIAMVTIEANAT